VLHKTKDEKFLISVYEAAESAGDTYGSVNRYQAGHNVGLSPKAVDTICVLLLRANFVKKDVLDDICLTKNGVALVQQLLEQ
jgi:hypothetical protein